MCSDAIEGADVMLYGVSLAYKESATGRLEANSAHQQELDMIPLRMSKDFTPKGWLGLILGTRLWCKSSSGPENPTQLC
jgi:hypothetical protein